MAEDIRTKVGLLKQRVADILNGFGETPILNTLQGRLQRLNVQPGQSGSQPGTSPVQGGPLMQFLQGFNKTEQELTPEDKLIREQEQKQLLEQAERLKQEEEAKKAAIEKQERLRRARESISLVMDS
jgi:hypothetical protein